MTNYTNLAGTSFASFQISLNGPVIYQGTQDPTVTPPTLSPNQGDLYFRHGSSNQIWSYNGAAWEDTAATFSGGTVSGNLDVTGQISAGDPLLVLNDGEAGPGATGGPSGLEVDRGPVDPNAQWVWDETNDWWTPAGFGTFVHSGVFIAEPGVPFPGGVPSYGFNGDPDTCIMSPGPDEIAFVTNDAIRWTINATGDLVPFGGGTNNVGSIVAHSASIYANRFFADPTSGALPIYAFIGDDDTGIRNPSGDNITFMNGNTDTTEIDSSGILRKLAGGIETVDGSTANAGYGFATDPTSGLYINGGDLVVLDSGTDRITFQAAETTFDSGTPVRVGAGAAATPGLTVGPGSDGLIRPASNTLGLVSNSVERLRVEANGLLTADPTGAAAPDYETLVSVGGPDSIPNKQWVLDNLGTAAAGGSPTEIQFNTGGVLDADSDFTWDKFGKVLTFGVTTTITSGGAISLNSTATGGSGVITIAAGAEGNVAISAGSGVGATTGGAVTINAGTAGSGGAGSVDITAGSGSAADGSPNGGNATLQGGSADTGGTGGRARVQGGGGAVTGGDVVLTPGSGTGTDGTVRLEPQAPGQAAIEVRFEEDQGGSNNYIGLKAPGTITTPRTWTLPQDNPALSGSGNLFITDSFGILSQAHNNNSNFPIAPSYTLATLPAGAAGGFIYVADATGSGVTGSLCFHNGTSWIDVTTGIAVV